MPRVDCVISPSIFADITAESLSGQQLLISPGITNPDELIVGCGLIVMSSAAYHLAKGFVVRAIDPVAGAIV
jgi:hypothetical protein